ncbi:hypothetical protein FSP39_010167 [Pinctada imbricata]|uniref:Proton-coupled folate transporter-like protein n=1 Tax=Pinctada imbricata TaxID=66713 RepID=A0AA89BZ61_PINIB|nr:hypothetical protein FSP39_010167 [Pinctada imbricata]
MTKSDEKEETLPLLSSSSKEKGLRTPTKNIFLPLGTFIYSAGLELGSTTLHQYAYNYTGQASSQNTSLFQDHDNQSELSCHRNSSKHQNANQEDAANWLMYFELMEYSIGIPMIILAGIYSDFIGRKFFILLSVFGSAGQLFCMFIVIYFDLHIGYLFISSAISGIVGTHYTFSLASSVLIADTTGTGKARSFHIALIHSYKGVGQVLANLGSGYLIQLTGFVIPSLISSALCFVACFTLSFEKETLTESIKTAKPSFCRSFLRFFGFFCGRGYRNNVHILKFVANLLCFMMIMCPEVAASSIRTLFILGEPFCFTSEMVGYFGAATDIANHIIGTVLLKLLHLCIHDESSTIIGFLSGIAKFLMIAFSMNAIMIFMSE